MMTRYYKVAGHTFAVSGQAELFEQMGNYEPFECEGGEPLFSLKEDSSTVPEYTEDFRPESGMGIIRGHTGSGNDVYEFMGRAKSGVCLICSKDHREGRLIMTDGSHKGMLDTALKMLFSLATAVKDTLIIHAVAVSCEGKGYMFIGPSGTGKSTHARLWLKHIDGTELVNDDWPVVRDGVVYGSPWSGKKTPCYRNVSIPIGVIVNLSQASYNKIHRLSGIEAYLNLYERIYDEPWSRCIAENIAEGLHQTMNKLASTVPMWHLECLPDEAAARLCYESVTQHNVMTRHYKVAGHTFSVSGRAGLFEQMENYEPFECEGGEPLFSLTEDSGTVPEYSEVSKTKMSWVCYIFGRTASGNDVFEYMGRTMSEGCLICSKDHREGRLIMTGGNPEKMLDWALMIMFALATAGKDTLLLHAVVVSQEGKGYLFIGPGGTGKSTHARLWLKHFDGTELVNDDFPVVKDGMVYGSPWSGKTNVKYPIGAIVRLSQAPYNKIRRLSSIEANQNLVCCDWGSKIWGIPITEDQHQTMNKLASTVPMWHLECLPDEAAARLCHETITNRNKEGVIE